MSAVAAPPFSVTKSFGPSFFAIILDVALYGVVFTLTSLYMKNYMGDKLRIKIMVATVMALETFQTALFVTSAYKEFVANFGNYDSLLHCPWEATIVPLTTAIIATLVQSFCVWRIAVLTRNFWLVGLIVVASLVQLGGGTGVMVRLTGDRYIPNFSEVRGLAVVWFTGALVANLLITGTLVFYLRRQKTGIKSTDTIIKRITRLTLETNLLTMIWVTTDIILFLVIPEPSTINLIFTFSTPKMYTISLLVSLNSRHAWACAVQQTRSVSSSQLTTHSMAGLQWARRGTSSIKSFGKHSPQIFIDVQSHQTIHVES